MDDLCMINMIMAWNKAKTKSSRNLSRREIPVIGLSNFFEDLLIIFRQSAKLESCSIMSLVYAYLISWFLEVCTDL